MEVHGPEIVSRATTPVLPLEKWFTQINKVSVARIAQFSDEARYYRQTQSELLIRFSGVEEEVG